MRNFLKADSQVRRMLLSQAGDKIGLNAKSRHQGQLETRLREYARCDDLWRKANLGAVDRSDGAAPEKRPVSLFIIPLLRGRIIKSTDHTEYTVFFAKRAVYCPL